MGAQWCSAQLHTCFTSKQSWCFIVQQEYILCTSHLPHRILKKSTQGFIFNKIKNFYHCNKNVFMWIWLFLFCKCMAEDDDQHNWEPLLPLVLRHQEFYPPLFVPSVTCQHSEKNKWSLSMIMTFQTDSDSLGDSFWAQS